MLQDGHPNCYKMRSKMLQDEIQNVTTEPDNVLPSPILNYIIFCLRNIIVHRTTNAPWRSHQLLTWRFGERQCWILWKNLVTSCNILCEIMLELLGKSPAKNIGTLPAVAVSTDRKMVTREWPHSLSTVLTGTTELTRCPNALFSDTKSDDQCCFQDVTRCSNQCYKILECYKIL